MGPAAHEPDNFRQFTTLDDVVYRNSGLTFDVNEKITFRVLVDNVFDTGVPFPVPAFGNTVSYFPGILGRYVRFRAGINVRSPFGSQKGSGATVSYPFFMPLPSKGAPATAFCASSAGRLAPMIGACGGAATEWTGWAAQV